jgi:hypothetical protein
VKKKVECAEVFLQVLCSFYPNDISYQVRILAAASLHDYTSNKPQETFMTLWLFILSPPLLASCTRFWFSRPPPKSPVFTTFSPKWLIGACDSSNIGRDTELEKQLQCRVGLSSKVPSRGYFANLNLEYI